MTKKILYFTAETLYASSLFTDAHAKVTAALESGKLRVDIGAVANKHQSVRSDIFRKIDETVQKLVLEVENPTQETLDFRIMVRFANHSLNTELYSGTLQPGSNLVTIDFNGMQMSGKKISYTDFYFSYAVGDYAAKTIYLQSMTINYK